ncbi:MAG: hypothetical protein GY842_05205 [bacterium]|nr:hypothetical protein [bacterium]
MSGLTCQNAHNLFDAHLNGELSPALETELSAHRVRCAACRHELALMEVAGDVVAADNAAPLLNDEFTSRLLACVAKQSTITRFPQRRFVRIGVAVLAAAACITLLVAYYGGQDKNVAGFSWGPSEDLQQSIIPPTSDDEPNDDAAKWQATFQAQVEEALTRWSEDASSLQRMYQFITPQIEEMGLDAPENADDQPPLFEPDPATPTEEDDIVSDHTVEDI